MGSLRPSCCVRDDRRSSTRLRVAVGRGRGATGIGTIHKTTSSTARRTTGSHREEPDEARRNQREGRAAAKPGKAANNSSCSGWGLVASARGASGPTNRQYGAGMEGSAPPAPPPASCSTLRVERLAPFEFSRRRRSRSGSVRGRGWRDRTFAWRRARSTNVTL